MSEVLVQLGGAGNPQVNISISELGYGRFKFTVTQAGGVIGDLRGLFFDIGRESLVASSGVQASVGNLVAWNQAGGLIGVSSAVNDGDDTVSKVGGGDTTMSGALSFNGAGGEAKGYDIGVEFGTAGIGKDDVGSATFELNLPGLTLSDLAGQDFGVRLTSVGALGGARDGSVKLTSASFAVFDDPSEALGAVLEDTTRTGDLLGDTVANTDGGQVQQTLTWISFDGGATKLAPGGVYPLGSTGATITIGADGAYFIDAQGADAMSAVQVQSFAVTYGVTQTYRDAAGHVVGSRMETSLLTFDIQGVNDVSTVSGVVTGAAIEDGSPISLDALANASDVDDGDVLSVVPPSSLPPGVSYDAATHSFILDPAAPAFQSLAAGQQVTITVDYGVTDGIATAPASVQWVVTGTNDAPVVSGPVRGAAVEDGSPVQLSGLANASDVDQGAVLTIVDLPPSLPPGVIFNPATGAFELDPRVSAYQSLAQGEQITVSVSYGVSDGAVTTPASVEWVVTGANDAPTVSGPVTGSAVEDGATVSLNALANAGDVDHGASLTVVLPPSLPPGVSYDPSTGLFTLDPSHAAYQPLAAGQTTTVTVEYGVSDGFAVTPATASWTVTGVAESGGGGPPPAANNFPLAPKDLSHVTFYFDLTPADKTDEEFFFVKIETPGSVDDDVDTWQQAILNRVLQLNPNLAGAELLGAAIKYGSDNQSSGGGEFYYAIDGSTDQDTPPTDHLIQGNEYKNYAGGVVYNYGDLI